MNVKNEIKSIIVRSGMTMQQVVDLLSEEDGWSDSISNFSNKLSRGSLRYREALQIADVMGFPSLGLDNPSGSAQPSHLPCKGRQVLPRRGGGAAEILIS